MRIYLDENMLSVVLVAFLRKAGHQATRSRDVGMAGKSDAENLLYSLQQNQVLLTRNHDHFEHLHDLVLGSGGHHSGIMTVRSERDRSKEMKVGAIVLAIRKLESARVPIADQLHILNQWR
jgi:predicted nuclease of predicted toxin-antitoxin system